MNENKYNGWTNYSTWRVNLEMFDGINPTDYGWDLSDEYALGQCLKDWAEEIICDSAPEGLAQDYALAFVSDVNWQEIAEHIICD